MVSAEERGNPRLHSDSLSRMSIKLIWSGRGEINLAACRQAMNYSYWKAKIRAESPPKTFIIIPGDRAAIVTDMSMLRKKDASGLPKLLAVNLEDVRENGLPLASATMAVRQKTPTLYKSRLCVRGDMLRAFQGDDVSAPTASRSSPEIPFRTPPNSRCK